MELNAYDIVAGDGKRYVGITCTPPDGVPWGTCVVSRPEEMTEEYHRKCLASMFQGLSNRIRLGPEGYAKRQDEVRWAMRAAQGKEVA